jgi:hypothetical protein
LLFLAIGDQLTKKPKITRLPIAQAIERDQPFNTMLSIIALPSVKGSDVDSFSPAKLFSGLVSAIITF